MKGVGGAGLVIIGFLFLYLAITGRLDCFFTFISCVTGAGNPVGSSQASNGSGGGGGINWGSLINTGVSIYNHGTGSGATTAPAPIPQHF